MKSEGKAIAQLNDDLTPKKCFRFIAATSKGCRCSGFDWQVLPNRRRSSFDKEAMAVAVGQRAFALHNSLEPLRRSQEHPI